MGWNRLDFAVANHEATHAVLAVLLRLPVESCTIDGPIVQNGWDADGLARVGTVASRRGLKRKLAVALGPSIAERQPILYPPRRNTVGDELVCAIICHVLDLGPGEWLLVGHDVQELLTLQSVRAAVTAVATALLEEGTLTGDQVRALVAGGLGLAPGDPYFLGLTLDKPLGSPHNPRYT